MSGSKRTCYWDTCIFLAWIKNEQRAPDEVAGIQDLVSKLDTGEIKVITSVATLMEITRAKVDEPQEQVFLKAMKNQNIRIHPIDKKVAEKSRELRNFYILSDPPVGKLSIADSIHLATAIIYDVDLMYTFDGTNPINNNGTLKLIPLNKNVAGFPLKIEAPRITGIPFRSSIAP